MLFLNEDGLTTLVEKKFKFDDVFLRTNNMSKTNSCIHQTSIAANDEHHSMLFNKPFKIFLPNENKSLKFEKKHCIFDNGWTCPTRFQHMFVHDSVWYYSILMELSSGIIVKVYIQVHMNKTVQVWIVTLTLTFHLDYQTVGLYRCCIVSVVHYRS